MLLHPIVFHVGYNQFGIRARAFSDSWIWPLSRSTRFTLQRTALPSLIRSLGLGLGRAPSATAGSGPSRGPRASPCSAPRCPAAPPRRASAPCSSSAPRCGSGPATHVPAHIVSSSNRPISPLTHNVEASHHQQAMASCWVMEQAQPALSADPHQLLYVSTCVFGSQRFC